MRNKAKNTFDENSFESLFKATDNPDKITGIILKGIFKKNYKKFFLSCFLFLIKHSGSYVLPIVTANIVNIATRPNDYKITGIYLNAVIAAILVFQNLFSHVWYINCISRVLRSIGADLRNSLIKKLQQLSLTFHKEFESGKLQSKFIRDIEVIESFLNNIMLILVATILSTMISAGITIFKSREVALFFVILIPINISVTRLFKRKMKAYNKQFRHEVENTSAKISTMIELIPVTKAHGLEEVEGKSIEKRITLLKEAGIELDHIGAQFGSALWVTTTTMSCICLAFTGILAYKGIISAGEIIMYQSYFNIISGNLQSLLNIYPELAKGAESLKSVSEIIISDNIEDNRGKIKLRYVHGSVQFKDVYFKYANNDDYSIKGFNLDVKPGECIAFVGASGSGKTTIMNMIIGFLIANKGSVCIDGKPIEFLNLSEYRHFISVVPQNCILFPGTIRENIVYGLENISDEQINNVVELSNSKEFIDKLPDGLDTYIEEHGGNLSGGQKQRISIARALIRDPKIIIFDEATSALDNISEYHIQQAMSKLIQGRTTFIVAHRLSTIRDADRIVVMEKGECIELGTYDELMSKKGKFYELNTLSNLT